VKAQAKKGGLPPRCDWSYATRPSRNQPTGFCALFSAYHVRILATADIDGDYCKQHTDQLMQEAIKKGLSFSAVPISTTKGAA
jgi:hypothetical protein